MAARCGFDGVEIIVGRNREFSDISFIKQLSNKYKMPVKALHSPFNSWQNDMWPKTPHEKIMRTVEMARRLEAGVVVAHTALSNEDEYKKWLINDLKIFQAKNLDIKIGIENMPRKYILFGRLGRLLFNFKKIAFKYRKKIAYDIAAHDNKYNILRPIELDDIKRSLNDVELLNKFDYITIDTTHLGTWNCEPHEYLDKITTEIAHVHLSNYEISREHRLPKDGRLDLAKFLFNLKKRKYSGGITIEADPRCLENHRSFETTSKQLIENIDYIKKSFDNAL